MYQCCVCALCAARYFPSSSVWLLCVPVCSLRAVSSVWLLFVSYAPGIWCVLCVFAVRCVLCVGPAVHRSVTPTRTYLLFFHHFTQKFIPRMRIRYISVSCSPPFLYPALIIRYLSHFLFTTFMKALVHADTIHFRLGVRPFCCSSRILEVVYFLLQARHVCRHAETACQ